MSARRRGTRAASTTGEQIATYFATERPVGHLISKLAAHYERAFLEALAAGDRDDAISAAEHAVLRCLAHAPVTSTQIAGMLGVSKQAIGKTVAALEQRGYVARTPLDTDLRAQVVTMTDRGRQLVLRSVQAAKSLDARTAKVLGRRDLATLKTLLARLADDTSVIADH